MNDRLEIGTVLKPQGILGEIKVKPNTDDVTRFKTLKKVFIEDVEYKVLNARILPDAVFLSLVGIADRNAAESLRNKVLKVNREDAVKLPKGSYFIVDVIGSNLFLDSGKLIGTVTDIDKTSVDVYTVKTTDDKIVRFPFLKDLVVSVDIENKAVTVKAKRFTEVAVYED